ncbi:UNVERIFIED_CONTAM: hypothetical protein Scaly_1529300 [Sesamum calycinum]|uniref:Exostosin GT47 domain-containing protein n=1 Tax=Sesamum calycinum TaxID=2727403 RepID=A0AAW2P7E8_9LAMI
MAPKTPPLFLTLTLLSLLSFVFFYLHSSTAPPHSTNARNALTTSQDFIKVYISPLPRSLNYGLLDKYWALTSDTRVGSEVDNEIRKTLLPRLSKKSLPYPENPIIKQYSAEYWILGDLSTPEELKGESFAERVLDYRDADVIFVPFFATLSAELQLVVNKDPVAMWHIKDEIAPAVLLVVDFGGWYRLDSKTSNDSSSDLMIHHTQVSLLKDVIVPYTYLLPRLHLYENQKRDTLLYFKGAKHRHRGGIVREKLWDLLINVPGVVMEEGFPNATGRSISDALRPNWLVNHLRSYSSEQKDRYRKNMARVQPIFQYDNDHPGGIGPIPPDGAVNHIWKKVHQKLPMIREAITRERRKPSGVSVPLRCHCT